MSDPAPAPTPDPTPEPTPPAEPEGEPIDLEGLVDDMVEGKLAKLFGGSKQPAPEVKEPAATPPAAEHHGVGDVERSVDRILAEREHSAEHDRLSSMGDQPPRQRRRGIARALFGE